MTETRHKTVLEVSVKATDVEKTAEGVKDLFDPDRLSDFARGVEQISRSFEFLQRNLEVIDRMVTKISAANAVQTSQAGRAAIPAGVEGAEAARWSYAAAGGGGDGPDRPGGAGNGGDRRCCGDGGVAGAAVGGALGASAAGRIREERDKEAHKWYKRQNLERWSAGAGKAFGPSGLAQGMASAIPVVGPALAGLLAGISQFAGAFASQQQAVASAFGHTGSADGMMGVGGRYGLGPNEVPGALSEFGQRSGMRGKRLGGAFNTNLMLSRGLGIGAAGSYVSAAETGGGEVAKPAQLMMEAVSAGLAAGVRVSRIDEYLQNISSWTDEARTKGINVSQDYALQLVRGLSASLDLKGEPVTQLARSQSERQQQLMSGSPSLDQSLTYQAAGIVLGPGSSLSDQQRAIERNDPRILIERLKLLQAYGRDHREGAFAIKQITGGTMSIDMADKIIGADFSKYDPASQLSTAEIEAQLREDKFARDKALAVSRKEASHEGKMVKTGGQVYSTQKMIEDRELGLASALTPVAAKGLEHGITLFEGAVKAFMEPSALFRDAAEIFNYAVDKLVEAIDTDPVGHAIITGELPKTPTDEEIKQREEEGKHMLLRGRGKGGRREGDKPFKLPSGFKMPDKDKSSSVQGLRDILRMSGELQIRAGDLIEQLGFANEGDVRTG